jgi:hypothetical protein
MANTCLTQRGQTLRKTKTRFIRFLLDLIVRRFSILILLPHPQGVYPIYLSQPQD